MSMNVTQTTATQVSSMMGHQSHGVDPAQGLGQQTQTLSPGGAGDQGSCAGGAGGGDILKDLMQLLKDVMGMMSGALGGGMGG